MKYFLLLLVFRFGTISIKTFAQGRDTVLNKNNDAYLNTALSFEERAEDLVSRMMIEEKISQMQTSAAAIPRLGIPKYDWWSECNHGVARNGIATVFPQVIGMAATWNPRLIHKEAVVISTEARAKYSEAIKKDEHGRHQGLTFFAPNINIVRDPRWGRNQETYGEDPLLTSVLAVAFIKGLQGNDPEYFKVIATAKHFAVHSGPEPLRHHFDAVASPRDLYETYFPPFEAAVVLGRAYSVMGAYSALNGTPDCANNFLLTDMLRKHWGFKGYVVSDCGAISDIYKGHKYAKDLADASAIAVKAGCDLSCGRLGYSALKEAFNKGLISEKSIDTAVTRLILARFKLGMFDPPTLVPYSKITIKDNNTPEHMRLARKVACESIVLLKNSNKILPLKKNLKSVAVIGTYADNIDVLVGNYNGTPSNPVTILQGIKNKLDTEEVSVLFAKGYDLLEDSVRGDSVELLSGAVKLAERSDISIVVAGISPKQEGEQLKIDLPGFEGGDRTSLNLPAGQEKLIKALYKIGKPVVLVLVGGSALAVNWEAENLPAIIDAWYPGEEGGNAVADVLFGDYNPAGRLPVTFYKSVNDLPDFKNYSMEGRTYRYFKGTPLYPFGYGLSYTSFKYQNISVNKEILNPNDTLTVSIKVKNTGDRKGDEVLQIYVKELNSIEPALNKSLKGFDRVSLNSGETKTVGIQIPVKNINYYDKKKKELAVIPGKYELQAGSSSSDIKLRKTFTIE